MSDIFKLKARFKCVLCTGCEHKKIIMQLTGGAQTLDPR